MIKTQMRCHIGDTYSPKHKTQSKHVKSIISDHWCAAVQFLTFQIHTNLPSDKQKSEVQCNRNKTNALASLWSEELPPQRNANMQST